MAYNVFGNPITDSTLDGMSEYAGKKKTNLDRACMALQLKNVGDKGKNAFEYVQKLKAQYGSKVSTGGLIYNATGNAITLVNNHDWHGCIGPSPFPIRIENGQWGGFLHVDTDSNEGSKAAVVYRGLDMDGVPFDWMVSWSNPSNQRSSNKVFTEIHVLRHFTSNAVWNIISRLLAESSFCGSSKWNTCLSNASIGNGSNVIVEAIFTLVNDQILPYPIN